MHSPPQNLDARPRRRSDRPNRPVRVCVFTLHPVTDMRVFDRQIMTLARNGYRVTIYGLGEGPPRMVRGVRVHPVARNLGPLRQRLRTIARLAWHAFATDADIYHFHDPDLLPVGAALRLLKHRPVIYDVHELYRIKFKLKASKYPWLQRLVTGIYGRIETALGRLIGNISAVYTQDTDRYRPLGCRVVLTPNYAKRELYTDQAPTREAWKRRRDTLIYVGAVNPARGALLMIEAMRLVQRERPRAELIVTRRFHQRSCEETIMRKLAEPEYAGTLRFAPDTPGSELPALVRQAMVGLSPLRDVGQYRIAVPSKFFDYMGESLAIIASDLPPSRTYVQDVGCGLLVPADDVEAWAAAILELLNDSDRAYEMGVRGHAAFRERFNWEACEPAFLEFYQALRPRGLRGGG